MSEIATSGRAIDTLLEKVLCMNILSSDYFKELYKMKTFHEVVDEIYNQVDHVEPWMTGNCRGPSTAFCLLYKFFTMKLTVKQMYNLLKHPDSPYIRAVSSPTEFLVPIKLICAFICQSNAYCLMFLEGIVAIVIKLSICMNMPHFLVVEACLQSELFNSLWS